MKSVEGNADGQKNVEMRRLIDDADARQQPLEIFQQEVPVFEESQHAQVHADAGDQPGAPRVASFGPGHLPAEPKIHRGGGKEQRGERRIPRAVENVARDYEKILPRIPGTDAPVRGDDDYKKDNEGKRIEEHYRSAICLSKMPPMASTFCQPCRSARWAVLGDDVAQSGETLPPAIFERDCRRVEPLLDLFPESAAIRNVWENELALVKGERTGAVAATER